MFYVIIIIIIRLILYYAGDCIWLRVRYFALYGPIVGTGHAAITAAAAAHRGATITAALSGTRQTTGNELYSSLQ